MSVPRIEAAGRIKHLTAVYLATLRVWLQDESNDQARTMAALDGHLRRSESLPGRFSEPQ